MNTTNFLNDFVKQFSESLPPPLKGLKEEFEKQFQLGLNLAFAKLKLVTREEFDIQAEVLARTRAKVEALEERLTTLEANINGTV